MRGIRVFEKTTGRKRFFVSWRVEGKRIAKAFVSEAARARFARSLNTARERIGRQALAFNAADWAEWLRFKELVGAVDPLIVAREWLSFRRGTADASPSLVEGVSLFKDAVSVAGASNEVKKRMKLPLESLLNFAGGATRVAAVDSSMLVKWLAWLKAKRKFEPETLRRYRAVANAFFRHLHLSRVIAWNPCAAVKPARVVVKDVTVLAVADAVKLFSVNRGRPVLTRLALEAFGGLRYTSAIRLEKHEVDWENRALRFPAHKHKSGR
ncbi:MAG: hypothetical protein LBI02_06850, partial [Opitutaceae bacterium]|nr:hypothetical protein [Opitutaceae bacterium]